MDCLISEATHCGLGGGSRSGKTFLLVRATVLRGMKEAKSRHAIFRFRFNALKASIIYDTLQKVFELCFPGVWEHCELNKTDWFLTLPNGSEIWFGGLDDKERTEKILGQEYCLDPDSKVLTADLRWVPAKSLTTGDEIVGFPEHISGNQTLERSVVERAEFVEAEKYRIVTDRGDTIVSAQHKFVGGKPATRNRLKWVEAQSLEVGQWIKFATAPWEERRDYDAGWLAGIYDGEGCISRTKSYTHCQVAQKRGVVLDGIKSILADCGVTANESDQRKSGVVNLHCAGMWQSMRLMGMIRPRRLMPKSSLLWEGRRAFNTRGDHHYAQVLAVEPLGRGPVVSLGTSTKTLIADGFLGHNCTVYFNECSQIPFASIVLALTRLAQKTKTLRLKAYYDFNPPGKRHWTYRRFIEKVNPETGQPEKRPENYSFYVINPADNRENLDPEYLDMLDSLPEKARNRFLLGKFADDSDGALWTDEILGQNRRLGRAEEKIPDWLRVVVAVDPSGCAGAEDTRSDEIGIAVCALGTDGHGYLLEDLSGHYGPQEWGGIVANAFERHAADKVVAERNFGGAMVEAVIRAANPDVPYREVTASRGKVVRAEPIAALYEQGKIHHIGYFPELEDQFCAMTTAGYTGLKSPDRADAVIWGFTELFPSLTRKARERKPLKYGNRGIV